MSTCPDCPPVDDIVIIRGTETTNKTIFDALEVLDESNPHNDIIIRRGISCLDIPADAVMVLIDEDNPIVMAPSKRTKIPDLDNNGKFVKHEEAK
jgi:hypothetical protein